MRLRNASIGYDEEGRPTLPPSSMLFEYDAEGRLSQVRRSVDNPAVTDKQFSSKAEPIAEYRYDSRGRLVSAIDSAGERAYEYDSSSRLAAVILEGGKTHLRMDDDGRIQELLSDGRPRLRYVYASAGRVASINFVGEHSASYDYDPRGFRRTASYGHGFTSHMRYDSAGNLIRYSLSNANGAITSQEYEIGDNNEVLHIHNTAQATQAPSISFRYDEAGRLLGAETGPRFLATEYDALELSVPMLAKVLQEGDRSYRSIIADGLVRQGSLAAVDVLTRNLGRFGDGEEGQWFDELLYRSLRQIAYPDISAWLLVRNPPDREAQNRAKKIVDRTYRGFMIID